MIAPLSPISADQIRAIRSMQRRLGLSDTDYRDMLEATAGKRSTRDLTAIEGARVIEKLKPLAPPLQPAAKGALKLSGPYAGICRALWISAYNLGVVKVGTDKALVGFVARQTQLQHLNWMREPAHAAQVIEALKDMIARHAGVQWDVPPATLRLTGLTLVRWRKLEIIRAQMRLLEAAGDHGPFASRTELGKAAEADLDRLSSALGRRLRTVREAGTARRRRKVA